MSGQNRHRPHLRVIFSLPTEIALGFRGSQSRTPRPLDPFILHFTYSRGREKETEAEVRSEAAGDMRAR